LIPRLASVAEAMVEVSQRAGLPVWIPEDARRHLLRSALELEGLSRAHRTRRTRWSSGSGAGAGRGRAGRRRRASCTQGDRHARRGTSSRDAEATGLAALEVLDSVAWAHDRLLPWLEVSAEVGPPPSTRPAPPATWASRAASGPSPASSPRTSTLHLRHLLRVRRRSRHHPPRADRRRHRRPGGELAGREFDARLSSNRTCEIALARATGERYESFLFLLEELTR
jgi:D-lactate dehydrogenase